MNKELTHLADVSESKNRLSSERDIRVYMTYLEQMVKLTQAYKQNDISSKLAKDYNHFMTRFAPFLGS